CQQIAGRWFITALASDSESFLQRKDELQMAMASIAVLPGGHLRVSFAIPAPEGCKKSEWIHRQMANPLVGDLGRRSLMFDFPPRAWAERSHTRVRVEDTDGRTYAIIFASRVKDGRTQHMLRLYSRTQEVSPGVIALFKKLAREKSFTDEMIKVLPSQEECSLDKA
ncbi:PREDICTED: extracellular fatty acid-binding protein-like, partial [Merops nubicus]|uniref:extracellular fatty acid-binding protein-like n=1 Tax=Merops nubicus TaxID=57421 RepID=UPI0004F0704D